MDSSVLAKKFIGRVRNILPPGSSLPDGRLNKVWKFQVRIPFLHENFTDDQLPYFLLSRPVFRGASAGIGEYKFPRVNSKVIVEFDANDIRSGYITGELQDSSNLPPSDFYDGNGNIIYYGSVDELGNKIKTNTTTGDIEQDTAGNYTINIPSGKTFTINCGNSQLVITDSSIIITSPEIDSNASSKFVVTSPTSTFSGNVEVSKDLSVSQSISAITSLKVNGEEMLHHTHLYSPGPGAPTPTGGPQ